MHASHALPVPERSPLWKVFWLYGVIPSNLLWLVVACLLGYTAWIVAAVWKAAPNAKDPRYGVMAQALTVAWAINTVLIAFFLGLQMVRVLVGG